MTAGTPIPRQEPDVTKELSTMPKRVAFLIAVVAVVTPLLALSPASASAAPSPWWQVLTGSYPTNLWKAEPGVAEITTELREVAGFPQAAVGVEVGGSMIGCLGTKTPNAESLCPVFAGGAQPSATAPELEAMFNGALGDETVEVTGGPVGGGPFKLETPGAVPAIKLIPLPPKGAFTLGSAELKVINPGGSGRLVLTITNLGNAPVDATTTPVTITDELPEGVVASGAVGFAGANIKNPSGPVDCDLESETLVSCTFEGTLPSYEAIEVEIFASLTGDPPVAGAPGKVSVSGGNAPAASTLQEITVSPDKTPFGIHHFSVKAEEEGGDPVVQAGSHPFQLTTTIQLNAGRLSSPPNRSNVIVEPPALPRNFRFSLPAGLIGNATAVEQCPMQVFFEEPENGCQPATAIGVASATIVENQFLGLARMAAPIFNLPPAEGEPARFGFAVKGTVVVIGTSVDPDDEYQIVAEVRNTSQLADILASTIVIWGNPGDPAHDTSRGWACNNAFGEGLGPCERPDGLSNDAFLRLPVSCVTPLDFGLELEPWNVPLGSVIETASESNGTLSGCSQIPFEPKVGATPTNRRAGGSSGLDFQLDMPNKGLLTPDMVAEGQAKKVEVILPEGVTVNPSQAEGLAACSPADYARETASSAPGAGCPEASKVASVEVSTPLIEEEVKGSLYIAKPFDNPFDSLLAIYMVAKSPERGVLVKQAGKIELDPKTGQISTTFDNLPQVPIGTFKVKFFEGSRAALVMPKQCGTYPVVTKFTPWHASNPFLPLPSEIVTTTSSFTVDQGCPSGTPPFKPGFVAGTENNLAKSFSPFDIRLTRTDEEPEFSRLSVKLPKGVLGMLAGIPFCSNESIAAAKARTGPDSGALEQASPSCPAASELGSLQVGAGVGPDLSYAPGKIYLAGPYQGAKLSVVAISTAKVGPFDLGNVVIRMPVRLNPETLEVTADNLNSDPIPHILQGIVVHARDIRVSLDRKNFIFNPTSCEPMTASATVIGDGGQSANVSSPFQAADCASLGFKPKLSLQLLGGTKRTATPRLKAVVTARKNDANLGRVQVTLPRSAFLEQAHIRTVCTRVQFNAGAGNGEQCPKASVYGKMKVTSPVLDEVVKGPVFLRSSDNELPDLVAALHSARADANLVGRIDSLNGRIRTTFDAPPDVPLTKAVLEMQGGQKGLIVNSTNICQGKHRAIANLKGQNGRRYEFQPVVKAQCGGKGKKGGRRK
jgi:hypothetical protein